MRFLDLPDEPEHPERASMDGAGRSTPKRRELPDPDERGRAYEVMRAHASAETAGESSDATGESQHDRRADGAGQRGYRDEAPRASWRCGQTTKDAGRRRHGMRRTRRHPTETAASGRPRNGRRRQPRRSAGSVRPSLNSPRMRNPLSRRTSMAAGWRASRTGSKARIVSKRRLPRSWRLSRV